MTTNDVTGYAYSAQPTRNPLRYAAAVWRLIRSDPAESTADAAVVEIGFARSRLGRRFARWGETVEHLSKDPRLADAFVKPNTRLTMALASRSVIPKLGIFNSSS